IQEVRAYEHGGDEVLDAFVESGLVFAARFIERHQRLDVVVRDGPPEGAAGKVRRDAPRARALLLDRLRLADENLLAAPRHAETGRREGADDVDVSDQPRHALLALVAEAAVRREAEDQLVRRRASPLDERDDDLADARFHRDGDIGEALHDLGPRRRAA